MGTSASVNQSGIACPTDSFRVAQPRSFEVDSPACLVRRYELYCRMEENLAFHAIGFKSVHIDFCHGYVKSFHLQDCNNFLRLSRLAMNPTTSPKRKPAFSATRSCGELTPNDLPLGSAVGLLRTFASSHVATTDVASWLPHGFPLSSPHQPYFLLLS